MFSLLPVSLWHSASTPASEARGRGFKYHFLQIFIINSIKFYRISLGNLKCFDTCLSVCPHGGYPHPAWWGYPLLGWMGVHPWLDGGTATPWRQSSTGCTYYAAGDMPLVFTQGDFLVFSCAISQEWSDLSSHYSVHMYVCMSANFHRDTPTPT